MAEASVIGKTHVRATNNQNGKIGQISKTNIEQIKLYQSDKQISKVAPNQQIRIIGANQHNCSRSANQRDWCKSAQF